LKSIFFRSGWFFTALLAIGMLVFGVLALLTSEQAEIIVEWSTASELDTVGYNLFRADSASSAFIKINEGLIPASPDPQIGGKYSFSDKNVVPGNNYFYELEAISEDGKSERHGPIIAQAQTGFPVAWPLAELFGVAALLSCGINLFRKRAKV
jgi:hypothetical protein